VWCPALPLRKEYYRGNLWAVLADEGYHYRGFSACAWCGALSDPRGEQGTGLRASEREAKRKVYARDSWHGRLNVVKRVFDHHHYIQNPQWPPRFYHYLPI
jgi:hypothetical protein